MLTILLSPIHLYNMIIAFHWCLFLFLLSIDQPVIAGFCQINNAVPSGIIAAHSALRGVGIIVINAIKEVDLICPAHAEGVVAESAMPGSGSVSYPGLVPDSLPLTIHLQGQ